MGRCKASVLVKNNFLNLTTKDTNLPCPCCRELDGVHHGKKSLNCPQECELGSKGTIKRKTRKCNLFCNIDTKKLNSGVARFTTCESNLSCSKSLCCRLRKVVAESREWFYFLKENLYMLRSPRQTCFAASDVTPMCGVQSEVSFHST